MKLLAEASVILATWLAVASFGGTEPVSFALVEILLFGTVAILLAQPAFNTSKVPLRTMSVPALLVIVVLAQLVPLGTTWAGRLAPPKAGEVTRGTESWSADPHSTGAQFLVLLACISAYYLVQAAAGKAGGSRLVKWLLALGTLEAFYGLIQYLSGWQHIFSYVKRYDLEEATGTYINRNHYAGMLEMVLPFCIALALVEFQNLRQGAERGATQGRPLLSRRGLARLVFWLSIAVVLLTALLFSRSRMGIVSATVSLVVMGALIAAQRFSRKTGLALLGALLVLGACVAVWIGPGPIVERFATVGQESSAHQTSRMAIWKDAGRLVLQNPCFGWGLGTFPAVFTSVQKVLPGQFVNHAHNDYLELAIDLGLPTAAIFFFSIVWGLIRTLRASLSTGHDAARAVLLGCAGSIVALLVHTATDFNLYIPANALLFAVVLGLAAVTVRGTSLSNFDGDPQRDQGWTEDE